MDVGGQVLNWIWTGFATGRLWIPTIVILLVIFAFLRSGDGSAGFFVDLGDSDGDSGGDGGD